MDKLKLLQDHFNPKGLKFGASGYGYSLGNMAVSLQGFPINCGVRVMTGLSTDRWDEDQAVGLIEYVKYQVHRTNKVIFYTINSSQRKFEKAFLRAGFVEIFDSFNPGHGAGHVIKGFVLDLKNYKNTVDEDEVFKL